MTISVKKCDDGVPLPEGSSGTFFTWDTWDDEAGRSISQHEDADEARRAAACMEREPRYRELLDYIVGSGCKHGHILEALVAASKIPAK